MDRSLEMRLRLDISHFQRGAREASRDMDQLIVRATLLDSILDRVEASSRRAGAGLQDVRTQVRGMGRDMDRSQAAILNAQRNLDAFNAAARRTPAHMTMFGRTSAATGRQFGDLTGRVDTAGRELDTFTGRLGAAAEAFLTLAPAAIPVGAVLGQSVGGLASVALAASAAGASMLVAFQGVGDAVKAVNEASLEPTVENIAAAQEAMSKLAPEAKQFVRAFQDFRPMLTEIRDSAAAGWFPGLTRSLDDFERLGPLVADMFEKVGAEGGSIVADIADSLDSKRWRPFLRYLGDELPSVMRSLATTTGDLTHGLAMMWRAAEPGNRDFLQFLEDTADAFDRWASSSEGRDDIGNFLEYARENGPRVRELFVSLVALVSAVTEAARPLGGPILDGLTAVVDAFTAIAESDLATPILAAVTALAVLRRGMALTTALATRMGTATAISAGYAAARGRMPQPFVGPMTRQQAAAAAAQRRDTMIAGAGGLAKTAALVGGLTLATSGLMDSTNLANTASLGLMGTLLGPYGAAFGAAAGFTLDLAKANDDLQASIDNARDATLRDPVETLLERRRLLVEQFSDIANAGTEADAGFFDQFSGHMGRISAWLSNDDEQTLNAVRNLDELIKTRRELDAMGPVDRGALVFNDLFGDSIGQLRVANSLMAEFNGKLAEAEGFLNRRGALVAYEASLHAVVQALKDNGRNLDATTEKGRANITALDGVAAAGLRMSEQLKGANRQRFLERLSEDVRSAAREFGLGGKKLRDYLLDLGLIDMQRVRPKFDADDTELTRKQRRAIERLRELGQQSPSPLVDLYTAPFDQGVAGVRNDLRDLNGDSATTYINVVRRETTVRNGEVTANPTRPAPRKEADGGLITGPGGPRDDRIPVLASNGEFVVNAAATSRNLGLLHSINAQRFAAGGMVGGMVGARAAGLSDPTGMTGYTAYGRGRTSADDFAKAIRDAAEAAAAAAAGIRKHGDESEKASRKIRIERLERSLDRARDRASAARDLRSQVGGSLAVGELFGNGLSGFDAALAANTNDTAAGRRALAQLRKKGLGGKDDSGGLYQLLAASGDLQTLQQFADLTPSQIRAYERRYASLSRGQSALGGQAVLEQYGRSVQGLDRTVAQLRKELRQLRKDVRDGAREGTRQGSREGATDRSRLSAVRHHVGV